MKKRKIKMKIKIRKRISRKIKSKSMTRLEEAGDSYAGGSNTESSQ